MLTRKREKLHSILLGHKVKVRLERAFGENLMEGVMISRTVSPGYKGQFKDISFIYQLLLQTELFS